MTKIKDTIKSTPHFLQSNSWKVIKSQLGNGVIDFDFGWMQLNEIPFINSSIGYLPRLNLDKNRAEQIITKAKKANCAWIQVDPASLQNEDDENILNELKAIGYKITRAKPIQLQTTVMFDLSLSEEKLFTNMKPKSRYNCRVAEKHGVVTRFGTSEDDFKTFLKLYLGTKTRQNYFGRGEEYMKTIWSVIKPNSSDNDLTALFAISEIKGVPAVAWFLFIYKGIAYLPYAGSAKEFQRTKATYKIVKDTLVYLKSIGVKVFDFYGIKETEQANDGFSSYKKGFGGEIIQYSSSYSIVLKNNIFRIMQLGLKLRDKVKILKKVS